MANLQYTTPKTDWAVPDIVQTTDMNNIGDNIAVNRLGGGESALVPITFANNIDIGLTYSSFYLSGTPVAIRQISVSDGTDNRRPGNIITLVFSVSNWIEIGYGPDTNYGTITSSGNIYVTQWEAIQLILIGAQEWVPIYIA